MYLGEYFFSLRNIQFSGFTPPLNGFGIILRNANAVLIANGEIIHSLRITKLAALRYHLTASASSLGTPMPLS